MCTKNDQLKDALQKAREHMGVKSLEPYYNKDGYKNPKHPSNRASMMNDAHHSAHKPDDLQADRPDWRDNPAE